MTGWIIGGAWALGYLAVWRRVVWAIATDLKINDKPDGAELIFGCFMGSMIAIAWPLIALGMAARYLYRNHDDGVLDLLMPRGVRREQKLERQAERIAKLERELGIGKDPRRDRLHGFVSPNAIREMYGMDER